MPLIFYQENQPLGYKIKLTLILKKKWTLGKIQINVQAGVKNKTVKLKALKLPNEQKGSTNFKMEHLPVKY